MTSISVSDITDIVLEAFDKFVNLMNGQLSLKTTVKSCISCSVEDAKSR